MKTYKTYTEIHQDLVKGVVIYWANKSYQVMLEPIYPVDSDVGQRQRAMAAVIDERMIVARCLSNWFGGRLDESEIASCFSEA